MAVLNENQLLRPLSTPDLRLDGKVAVVTGSTRGIGLAIARVFVDAGARIVVNGLDTNRAQTICQQLRARPDAQDRVHSIAADVTDRAAVDALISETVDRYGRLDILVNNAGGQGSFAPVVDLDDEAWQHTMDWNLSSAFWATRAALRHLVPQKSGRIINISSEEGKTHGQPGLSAYVTAKHALNGFTLATAKEVGPLGITVNAICPGLVLTDIVREKAGELAEQMGISYEDLIGQFEREAAIRRTVTVDEVAALALLVASDAGAGIAGALLSVDGGIAPY